MTLEEESKAYQLAKDREYQQGKDFILDKLARIFNQYERGFLADKELVSKIRKILLDEARKKR